MPRLTAVRKQALDQMMKQAIFEAAVAVLTEHGVEGLTMDRVALAANMAKGSLYRYFSSKKDLVEFVYANVIDPIHQHLRGIVATEQPAIEKLATHLYKVLEHVAKHVRVFKLLFHDDMAQGLLRSSQRRIHEAGCQLLAEVFRQGVSEGVFRPADPLVLARIFFGVCMGVFDGQPELQGCDQRETVHRLIMGTFLHGVATERGQVG